MSQPLFSVDVQRVFRTRHGNVKQTALFLFVQRPIIAGCSRVSIAQRSRELHQRFVITAGKRTAGRPQDEDVSELQSFRSMDGHQSHRIVVLVRRHRNRSASFAKILQILNPFAEISPFRGRLTLPHSSEIERSLHHRQVQVQAKLFTDQLKRSSRLRLLALDRRPRLAYAFQHRPPAAHAFQNRRKGHNHALLRFARNIA